MKGLIHIGANDGREYVGTDRLTLLFEPQQEPFKRLVDLHLGNEKIIKANYALGTEGGMKTMFTANNGGMSSSILKPKVHLEILPGILFEGGETVRMTTLDDYMEENNLRGKFDEIVIDVQGYELEVFKGARQTLVDINRITAEVNRDEVYEGCTRVEQLDEFLAGFGFERVETSWHGGCWGDAVYAKISK